MIDDLMPFRWTPPVLKSTTAQPFVLDPSKINEIEQSALKIITARRHDTYYAYYESIRPRNLAHAFSFIIYAACSQQTKALKNSLEAQAGTSETDCDPHNPNEPGPGAA